MFRWSKVAAMVALLTLLSGCPNSFSEFANKTSDEALLFQAQQYADAKDWDNAILSITSMSSGGLADPGTKYVLASYYAGRCGLDFLQLASDIAGSNGLGSNKLYPFLLKEYKANTPTNLTDCISAENTLLSISTTYSALTPDENVLLAMIEFTKVGSVMAANGNFDSNDDGTIDAGFNPCAAGSMITDHEVGHIGTGLIMAIDALNASGSTMTQMLGSAAGTLVSAFGNVQDPDAFATAGSPNDYDKLRTLIKANEVGFSSNGCSGGSYSSGACSCP